MEVALSETRPRPSVATKAGTLMRRKESDHPIPSQIGRSESRALRVDDRIREDHAFPEFTALEIAEEELATGYVIAVVRERLHDAIPVRPRFADPTCRTNQRQKEALAEQCVRTDPCLS